SRYGDLRAARTPPRLRGFGNRNAPASAVRVSGPETLDLPGVEVADPLPPGPRRGDPRVIGSRAVAQGVQVGTIHLDPLPELDGIAGRPVPRNEHIDPIRHLLEEVEGC